MAVTKQKRTQSKRRTPAKRKTTTKRRRRRMTKKKGFLSEIMTSTESKAGFQATTSGMIGGGIGYLYNHFVEDNNWSSEVKCGLGALGGFLIASMGKRPNTGAGVAGSMTMLYMLEQGFLNDGASREMKRINYADPLTNLPETLSEDEAMYLQQNGMYLQQDDNGNMYLADENGYQVDYAPQFGGVGEGAYC